MKTNTKRAEEKKEKIKKLVAELGEDPVIYENSKDWARDVKIEISTIKETIADLNRDLNDLEIMLKWIDIFKE
jgi:hypothetical protein